MCQRIYPRKIRKGFTGNYCRTKKKTGITILSILKMKTNFSISTSLPAYRENPAGKQNQKDVIFSLIPPHGTCLKELEHKTGLPQSTVAGRISDIREEGRVIYEGTYIFEGRLRKRIVKFRGQTK